VDEFTTREAYRGPFGSRTKVEEVRAGLEVLVRHGIIRRLPDPPKPNGGSKSEPWAVHPEFRTPEPGATGSSGSTFREFVAEEEL
jgi:hypothetical protein